jgi:hypothetical protein
MRGWGAEGGPLSFNRGAAISFPTKIKKRECGAFPPSLGARPALRLPPVPTGMGEHSFRKMAKGRPRKKYLLAKIACAMTRQHKSFFDAYP